MTGKIIIENYHLEDLLTILLNDGYVVKLSKKDSEHTLVEIYEKENK